MINEKTLEINIDTEIINDIRKRVNKHAFIIGTTLRDEGIVGYDSAVSLTELLDDNLAVIFQFKAVKEDNQNSFLFRINNNSKKDQHQKLLRTSIKYPFSTFYVFPLYSKYKHFYHDCPDFLKETWFLNVRNIGNLNPPNKEHDVEVFRNGLVIVHSEPIKLNGIKWNDIISKLEQTKELFKETPEKSKEERIGIPLKNLLKLYKGEAKLKEHLKYSRMRLIIF